MELLDLKTMKPSEKESVASAQEQTKFDFMCCVRNICGDLYVKQV